MVNNTAILANNERFLDYVAELCVGSCLFESAHGNPFNDGIRFASKWIFDGIMLNGEIPDNVKERFAQKCAMLYVKEKSNASNDGPSGLFQ